jgi:cobalt/nickel transport system permease protein
MHIPDGFLDAKTAGVTAAFSFVGLGASLRHASRHLPPRKIPLIGLAAAFVFVAQMINFPIAAGTSGHLLGATLSAVLLGPSAAVIVMSTVLIVQALLFADGGILALGANIFNMAIVGPLCGYGLYRLLHVVFRGEYGRLVSVGVASWFSTVVAAVFCAGELAWSGTAAWNTVFPAMAGVHMATGLGEAAITMLVIASIARARPELLTNNVPPSSTRERSTGFVLIALLIIGVLLLVAPHASELPDGLEKVASTLGFEHRAISNPAVSSPLEDYRLRGIGSTATATIIAGVIGIAAVIALSLLLARVLIPRDQGQPPPRSPHNRGDA